METATGNSNGLSHVPSKRKEEIKPGTSGCGSFVVPYFQPATSTNHLLCFAASYAVSQTTSQLFIRVGDLYQIWNCITRILNQNVVCDLGTCMKFGMGIQEF